MLKSSGKIYSFMLLSCTVSTDKSYENEVKMKLKYFSALFHLLLLFTDMHFSLMSLEDIVIWMGGKQMPIFACMTFYSSKLCLSVKNSKQSMKLVVLKYSITQTSGPRSDYLNKWISQSAKVAAWFVGNLCLRCRCRYKSKIEHGPCTTMIRKIIGTCVRTLVPIV